ncbi:MerR family transcriptional regulator, partial [Planococcus sp. ISL-110]|uniref:MerR family transcriptional regulator n=1 Tax=Planococcus sp. ISL-110 TaxID=2819167 RepID=UPI001BE566E1
TKRGGEQLIMTPSEVCKQLKISPSTLRKYSLRFESEGILFKRNKSNSRIYTVTEVAALRDAVTVTKSGGITLENAVREAADGLKGTSTITPENGVTSTPPRRHDDVATAVILKKLEDLEEENRSLKEEMRKRDSLFVEVLEEMKHKLDRIEENQKQLAAPTPEEPEIEGPELSSQQEESEPEPVTSKKDTRGLWARIWNK